MASTTETDEWTNSTSANDAVPSVADDDVSKSMLMGIFAALTAVGNGFTLVVVLKTPVLSEKSKDCTFQMLLSTLTGSDVLLGLVVMERALWPKTPDGQNPGCRVYYSVILLASYSRAFVIVLIALDRAVATASPFAYRAKVTPNKMLVMIAFVWVLSAVFVVATVAGGFPPNTPCRIPFNLLPVRGFTVAAVTLLVCALAASCLYMYLAWMMKTRMAELGRRVSMSTCRLSQNGISPRQRHAAATGLALAVVSIVGSLPLSLYILLVTWSDVDVQTKDRSEILYGLVIFLVVSCVLDPVVYFWRIKGLWPLCTKWRPTPTQTVTSTSQQKKLTT
ncbi:hypothetical protein BaRGS_00020597 [Batillaria attramentaria]|uniref:G-protein coupled receptors family 1 profile domain-containing protein n=1 Tax=Batillaria attramentaria TaxID=370345 RepID=A0ABD0KMP6_9CAEN